MGGSALKNTFTRRYSKEEYERLSKTVATRLKSLQIKNRVPLAYAAKKTFGDLDVLILTESLGNKDMRTVIEDHFAPNEIYHNSSVYSFDYKEFQIDFILVKTKYWDTSYHYYSYNDLGNLIGRISYQMGFRYGHYGLKLVYRHYDGGRKFEMLISQDIKRILEFLGFNVSEYDIGFYELRDIFAYVIKSKYFNPKIFQYEALNHQNKTRNKKRVNYAGFLEYIKGEKFDNPYEYQDKDHYVNMAENFFGLNIVEQIDSWKKVVEKDKLVSAKFNGRLIMEKIPILKGKELGNAITKFKNYIKPYLMSNQYLNPNKSDNVEDIYKDWIIENDVDHIFLHFKTINNIK